ncbi:MAG: hypothetical protein IJL87_09615 [Clostridia bacterium]|nr:hypothetical protein [Clostridia bacterium]
MIKEYLMPLFYLGTGFMLVFFFGRENKLFYPLGGGFTFLGIWELAKIFTGDMLTTGFLNYVPKIIGAFLLIFACLLYVKSKSEEKDGNGDA